MNIPAEGHWWEGRVGVGPDAYLAVAVAPEVTKAADQVLTVLDDLDAVDLGDQAALVKADDLHAQDGVAHRCCPSFACQRSLALTALGTMTARAMAQATIRTLMTRPPAE